MAVIKKSKVDPEDAKQSINKFYHFHIEAFDESITLNKMDKDLNMLSEEKVPKRVNFQNQFYRPYLSSIQKFDSTNEENYTLSNDILDQSPDVKRFSKRKAMYLDYMEKIKENQHFRINPSLMMDDKKT